MRILIGCLLMLVLPPAALVGFKVYEQYESQRLEEERAMLDPARRRGEVLFFNASWCGPCQRMKPIVSTMRRQGFRMRDIDVDRNQPLAQKYGVRGIPTFVFLQNGKEVHRFSGGTSADNLKRLCSNPAYR
jgi:thioredoxin 1